MMIWIWTLDAWFHGARSGDWSSYGMECSAGVGVLERDLFLLSTVLLDGQQIVCCVLDPW
jgi:hypothetical protein